MGDQRRTDQSHDVRSKARKEADHEPDRDEEHFDDKHAHAQLRAWPEIDETGRPESMVKGVGDQEQLYAKFEAALVARDRPDHLLQMLVDMNRETRATAAADHLGDLAQQLAAAQFLRAADIMQAPLARTLKAVVTSGSPPTLHQMRAYLADVHPDDLSIAIMDKTVLEGLKSLYKGSATLIAPQITDERAFWDENLLRWYLDTTPSATVAREMMSSTPDEASTRAWGLNKLGRAGWLWVFHIDDAMAASGGFRLLSSYEWSTKGGDDVKSFLHSKAKSVEHVDHKALARDLATHRKDVVSHSSTEDIANAADAAGMEPAQQLAWMLDKPGIKLEDIRAAAAAWDNYTFLSASIAERVMRRFPGTTPADIFGDIPDSLYRLAITTPSLRPWFVDHAEPIEILRFVTFDTNHIGQLCQWLVAHKTGYSWVYELGGGLDDHLLRRFVLKCPDPQVASYVRERILADAVNTEGTEITAAPYADAAYRSKAQDLDESLATKAKPSEVSASVDTLSDEEVVALRHDAGKLRTILERMNEATLPRVLDRIQPPLIHMLNASPIVDAKAQLADWVRTRPADQVREALSNHHAAAQARKLLPAIGPLELFPPLESPAVLAPVLQRNPDIAEWIITASEPIAALRALGDRGVAMPAVQALAKHSDSVDSLPPGKMLPKAAHAGLEQLVAFSKGELHDALKSKLQEAPLKGDDDDVSEAQTSAQYMLDAEKGPFLEVLQNALEEGQGVSAEAVLRICRAHAEEVPKIANRQPELFTRIHERTQLSPLAVFSGQPLSAFLTTEPARAWAFRTVAGWEILRSCGGDRDARSHIVDALNSNEAAAFEWVRALPRGRAVNAAEQRALHSLASAVTDLGSRDVLFYVRFDTRVKPEFDKTAFERLWNVLERIPEAHIEQGSVSEFSQFDGANTTTGGAFYPEGNAVTIRDKLLDTHDTHEYDRKDSSALMTKDEAKAALGLDDAMFAQWLHEGRIVMESDRVHYRLVQTDDKDSFTTVVLHEVGHSVDHMLGEHSELVFGLAGWRAYAESDFDQWATDLGGWTHVSAADQKQIKEVWTMWLSSSRGDAARESVGDMVASDHPAVAKKYEHVGVVDIARKHQSPDRKSPAIMGDKAALVNHGQQRFYTMNVNGLRAAPSDYSLTAPGEYFAECYAHYYKDYDGTPKTADKKGATLATWIKTWFDKNIDAVGHNPKKR